MTSTPALARATFALAAALLGGCSRTSDTPAAPNAAPAATAAASAPALTGIAWRHATTDGDVDAAFALALNVEDIASRAC